MTSQELAVYAGIILSLIFAYVPGLNVKFAALTPEYKRLIMLGLLALVALGVYGAACAKLTFLGVAVTCDQAGLQGLILAFVGAAIANQATYAIAPLTGPVRAVLAAAK